jgi:small-conductance mechanosensitive channel
MIGLQSSVGAAIHDPLVIAMVVLALAGLLTHLLFRKHPLGRAIARVIFLVALTIVLLKAGVAPYRPLKSTGVPFADAVHAALAIAWWLWGAWFLVGVLRAIIIAEHRRREGKLIQDLLAGLIYLAALLAIIAYVFDLPVQGLIATSGAIAIILGLALQSTLSDVFSGLVLNFSRPYLPGDWISIDGGTDGRVIEMNWRATHVLTAKRDLAIVPNSVIGKAKIINASSPSRIHGMSLTVKLDGQTPPAVGIRVLEHAVLNCRRVLATPAPAITVTSITATCAEFDITFFVEERAQATQAQNELYDLIFRHLAAAGIGLATVQNLPYSAPLPAAAPKAASGPERVLDLVAIFAALTADEQRLLAAKMKSKTYDQGEALFEPGTVLQSLFIVGAGVLSLTQIVSEAEIELMRLGPGDHFGEIGLLTGAAVTLRILALVPTTVYELTKSDLTPILETRPIVTEELCRALAQRQAAGQLIASPDIDKAMPAHRVATWFSERLRTLFDLAGTYTSGPGH